MKTRTWILLLAGLALLLGLLCLLPVGPAQADAVQLYSDGELIATLPLFVDRVLTVEGAYGTNTVTVSAGKVAVTAADCPDGYCMQRGFCSGGNQIVCLPNRLVIVFLKTQKIDAISG